MYELAVTSSYGRCICQSTNDGSGATLQTDNTGLGTPYRGTGQGAGCDDSLEITYVKSPFST